SDETRYRSAFDGWYTLETPINGGRTVKDLLRYLITNGSEIGLHLSIGAHQNPQAIAAEWNSLSRCAPTMTTCRSHSLKHRRGVTDVALAAVGARAEL